MAYNIDNETIMQVWNDLKKEKEKTKKKNSYKEIVRLYVFFVFGQYLNFLFLFLLNFA